VATHVSARAFPSRESLLLNVFEALGGACGVEVDPFTLRESLQRAERENPAPISEAWRLRLIQTGKELGLRVTSFSGSLHQAAQLAGREGPVVIFQNADAIARCWMILEKTGRRLRVLDFATGSELSLTPQEAAALFGLSDENAWIEAAIAQPLRPCSDLESHGHPHGQHGSVSPLRRLLGLLHAERRDLKLVVLFAIGIGILTLATPIAVEALVTNVAFGGAFMQPVIVLSFVLFGFLAVAAAIRSLKNYVVEIMQQRIFIRVVADLAYRLPRVHCSAFDRQHGPEMVNRFFEVLTIQKAGSTLLMDGMSVIMQAFIGLVVLAVYHPLLLGFDLILLLAIGGIIFGLGRRAITTSIEESKAKYAMASWLEEIVRHPLAFKLSGGPDFAMQRADQMARAYLAARKTHFRVLFRQIVGSLALQAVASVAFLGLGGFLVIQQQLTLGQLVAGELIVTLVLGSVAKMGKSLENFYDLAASVDKLGHLVDLPLERENGEGHEARVEGASLRFHEVAFHYEGSHLVFSGLNWSITPGERVALVGPNGSGKSTLVDLLYGLREPTAGHIELDGIDLRDVKLDAVRSQVATVRSMEIFAGTIVENVRMGRSELSPSAVRAALDDVGLLEEFLTLPDGLQTVLSTGGGPLSNGQARRLMLARAIAAKPRLLVLDESLDGLDGTVRERVLDTLFDPQSPWTLLAASHDDEVRRRCDRELCMPPVERHGRGNHASKTH